MVPTQQLPSSSNAAQLVPSGGKIPQKQAGEDDAFARLLGLNNASATALGPDSSAGSARAAQPPALPPGNEQQAKPPVGEGASQPSGISGKGQAAAPSPAAMRNSLPASDLAFLARALYESGSPPGAAEVQVAAGTSAKTGPNTGTKNAKEAGSESSQEAIPAASQMDAAASGSVAAPAVQIQIAPAAPLTVAEPEAAEPKAAEQGQSAERASTAGVARSSSTAERAPSQANANAQALPQSGKATPPASGFVPEAGTKGIPAPGGSRQGQAVLADGAPPPPAAVTPGNSASSSQSAGGVPSKLAAEGTAQSFTVKDVRTYLAPERQTAKLQAREGASGAASSLSMDASAVEAKASSPRQAGQPAAVNAGSPVRSGGEPPAPEQTVKPAVQSSETSSAPTASTSSQAAPLTGQAAPPPGQQIFNAIQSAMSEAASSQLAAKAGSPSAPAGYQPLKTITVALQPDGLGTVAIQLSLKARHLGVRVEASEAGTAQLLRQHDGDLTALLKSAGYTVSSIAVHTAPQQAPAENAPQAGTGGQGGFSPSNPDGRGTGGGGTGGTGGEAKHQPGSRDEQREGGYGRPDTPNGDKSLYV